MLQIIIIFSQVIGDFIALSPKLGERLKLFFLSLRKRFGMFGFERIEFLGMFGFERIEFLGVFSFERIQSLVLFIFKLGDFLGMFRTDMLDLRIIFSFERIEFRTQSIQFILRIICAFVCGSQGFFRQSRCLWIHNFSISPTNADIVQLLARIAVQIFRNIFRPRRPKRIILKVERFIHRLCISIRFNRRTPRNMFLKRRHIRGSAPIELMRGGRNDLP